MMNIVDENNVSRETLDKLKQYESLVLEWNNKFNLISKSSAENIWNRHILDSLQLCSFIEEKDSLLLDLGSGAGFPAIVIAIVAQEKFPKLNVKLIESIGKKTMFLNVVKEELNINIEVIKDRIENLTFKNVDVITSRALASLPKLLEYAEPFCSKKTKLIFPKGINWEEEVNLAKKQWNFEYEKYQSITDSSGKILSLHNIRKK